MDELIRRLAELNAAPVLTLAVLDGQLTKLACAMPICTCPAGRAYFERRGDPRYGPWAPSADRWPIPGRDGGKYVTSNIRLAHKRCNQSEGGRYGGIRGAAALTYEQRAAGGRAAVHFANDWLNNTPEGRATRTRSGQIGIAKVTAARKASGQYQSVEHRELGRRLGLNHGIAALHAWNQTPEAHGVHVATGHMVGAWQKRKAAQRRKSA